MDIYLNDVSELGENEEIALEKDDRLLCDLHLNSPLNIDHIRKILGDPLKYNSDTDARMERSIRKGVRVYEGLESSGSFLKADHRHLISGAIPVKIALTELSTATEEWKDPIVIELIKAAREAFQKRGIRLNMDRILRCYEIGGVICPAGLPNTFREIMSACLLTSELLRGGEQPKGLEGSCSSINEWMYCTVKASDGTIINILSDGTSVHFGHQGRHHVTVWEDLLAILDTLGQRISVFTSHCQAIAIGERGGIDIHVHCDIIREFDRILREYGNAGYQVVGMFETLCVSQLLRKNPDGINDPLLLTVNMYSELGEIAQEIGMSVEAVGEIFDKLFEELERLDDCQLSNLFCEYRIWGHPYVDIYEGMKKVHKIGTTVKTISSYLPNYVVRIFKENVITGFYKKKGRYPKEMQDKINQESESYICRCIRANRPVEKYASGYILEDWDEVELCELFPIPSTYDITHILNDKAISPKLSELVRAVHEGIPFNRMEGRRGILAWLKGNTLSCRDLLKEISKNGISKEDSVIGLSEKEREIKVAARMFALMSEIMRYYFVITEGLIADHILEYFPQITMKDSLNKLQKRLWTAGTRSGGAHDTNINIDFSKWNTNMRSELMTPMFDEMDKLFGLKNVIGRTHEIFTQSLIYSCSGKYTPRATRDDIIEDAPMCYRGHLGGMEGLRQKGWTVGTVCLIEYVARLVMAKYNLMGQGDNQILKLKTPETKWRDYEWSDSEKNQAARSLADDFVETLERIFGEVGLPVKPRECWRSHRLFMYGKSMLLDNCVLSQWSKKLLRSYALSNEGVLTVGGTIGTIASNCMSSCSSMENPELGYCIYLQMGVWTLRFLSRYHPFSRMTGMLSDETTFRFPEEKKHHKPPAVSLLQMSAICLLVPSICGGSTNIPFTTYVMRGFPDPASEAYSWLKALSECSCRDIAVIATNFYTYKTPKRINISQLAEAPLSINHVKVLAPTLSAKEESREFIRQEFGGLNNVVDCDIAVASLYEGVNVAEVIATDPLNPALLSEIHALYPHSIMSDLMSRIQSTSTLKKIALKRSDHLIIRRLQAGERAFLSYLRWRAFQTMEVLSDCATQHVRLMRNVGWGREITGVTTPHPLEFASIGCHDTVECKQDTDYIYVLRDDRGGFSPYLGSSVRNKVTGVGDTTMRTEPILKGVSRMASYANWMGLGPNYRELIMALGELYGGLNARDQILHDFNAEGNYTGSMDHRFRTGTMSEGCFINYAPQVGSRVFMTTDNMTTYGRGNTNYTLQFQALFCWSQIMVQRTSILHHGHVHVACDRCVVPVVEETPDIGKALSTVISEAGFQMSKIMGVDIRQNVMLSGENEPLLDHFRANAVPYERVSKDELRISITIWLAARVARELMGEALEESVEVGTEIADLQKYPRIYGKKIYTDELLEYTSMFCLILGAMKKELSIDGVSLYRVKRYVLDRLSHVPFHCAAGLGSLIIDAKISDYSKYLEYYSSGSCFPTTIQEHIVGGLCTLRRYIQGVGSLARFELPKRWILPMVDINQGMLALMIVAGDVVYNTCGAMLSVYAERNDPAMLLFKSCGSKHAKRVLSSMRPVERSIDKLMKDLRAIDTISMEFCPVFRVGGACAQEIDVCFNSQVVPKHVMVRGPPNASSKDYREITLPTASVYKWDEAIRSFDLKKYNIVLGDGTGTSSYTMAVNNPDKWFFPMALIEKRNITPQDLTAILPPVSKWVKNVSHEAMLKVRDDINCDDFISSLGKFLSQFKIEDVMIVSDIEIGGGSLIGHSRLKDIVGLGATCLIKCYIKELHRNYVVSGMQLSECRVMYSRMGNLEYGEMFLSLKTGEMYLDVKDILYGYESFRGSIDLGGIRQEVMQVSRSYPYLSNLSINLSIRYLESLGLNISREMLSLGWRIISMYFISYINNHYIFRAEGHGAKRGISPRKRRDLERLFVILMLITTDRNFSVLETRTLKLIHHRDGIHARYRYKKGFVSVENYDLELSGKDIQAANCLYNVRRRTSADFRHISSIGDRMSDRHEELLGVLNDCNIGEAAYLCSETFESGSEYMADYTL